MEDEQLTEEVIITDPDGKVLDDGEAKKLLVIFQQGVCYIPQNR